MLGDPARHVAQLLADAGGVHVKDDAGKRSFAFRRRHKRRHPSVLGGNDDLVFNHPDASLRTRSPLSRHWSDRATALHTAAPIRRPSMANDTIDQPLRAAVNDGRVPGVVALAADRSG